MSGRRLASGSKNLSTVAASGDRLATLERLRQELAEAIDAKPEPRDLASLSRRLEAVLEQIGGLAESDVSDPVDELRRKRAQRVAGAGAAGS